MDERLLAAALLALPAFAWAQDDASSETVETIPVEPLREEEPEPGTVFPEEGPGGFSGRVFVAGGYDTNANSSTDVDRFFFFDLPQESTSSSSPFAGVGANLGYLVVLSERLGWQTSVGGEGRWHSDAPFADSAYGTGITQLRWTGQHWRTAGGVIYTTAVIDDAQANRALGLAAQVEHLGTSIVGLAVEHAGWRFPSFPLRDVDTTIVTASYQPGPLSVTDWSPDVSVQVGHEAPRIDGSPFERSLYGVTAALARPLAANLGLEIGLGLLHSSYEGPISSLAEKRSDTRYAGSVGMRWRPADDANWNSLIAVRMLRNDSNELAFDITRVVLAFEIHYGWKPEVEAPSP